VIKYFHTDHLILLLIILAGSVLRFYDFQNLMFTFDEFSALFRTGFDDFGTLIQKGVVEPDTHPAGVQVFLNYWVKITGHNEMLIRLPFVLMGIASIILVYLLGKSWFNPTVGLIGAMFLAFLQYPITYSVFARPYASGLFFCLMMILLWSKAFIEKDQTNFYYLAGYVIAGALCAYNHYFSLFLLGLVGTSGLFIIGKKKLLPYLLANLAIFILFIPHLRIFFIQLEKGGVGNWLSKPDTGFWIDYLQYILHFSRPLYWVSGLILVLTFVIRAQDHPGKMRFRVLLLAWVLVTWLGGYFYSVYVNAVLQYSVLIFTFPLFVVLSFSFSRDLNPVWKLMIIAVFAFVSLFSLISGRRHYEVLYQSGYIEIPEIAADLTGRHSMGEVTTVLNMPPKILDYYIDKLDLKGLEIYRLEHFGGIYEFRRFLSQQNSDYLVFGWSGNDRLEYLPVAMEYYPFVEKKMNWFLCDLYFLSKEMPGDHKPGSGDLLYSFQRYYGEPGVTGNSSNQEITSGELVTPGQEYFPLFRGTMDDMIKGENNLIVITMDVSIPPDRPSAMMVSEMHAGDELFDWRSVPFIDFYSSNEAVTRMHQVIHMANFRRPEKVTKFNTFVWNKHNIEFRILFFKLDVYEGNPILYGLFEKITD
jgi:hypothetical protein